MDKSLLQILTFCASRLAPPERVALAAVGAGMLAVAVLEMGVVAAVAGFTTLIATSGEALESVLPAVVLRLAGDVLEADFERAVTWFAAACVVTLFVKNCMQAVNLFFLTRLAMQAEASLGRELLLGYAQAPYLSVQSRNAEDIAHNVRWRSYYGRNFLTGVMGVAANAAIASFLVIYLLFTRPLIAVMVIAMFSVLAFAIGIVLRSNVEQISRRCLEQDRGLNRKSAAFVDGLRQIRVSGGARLFADEFGTLANQFADTFAGRQVALRSASWLMETVGLAVLVVTILAVIYYQGGLSSDVSGVAALIVVTAWRLLRSLVDMQREISKVRTATPFVSELIDEAEFLARNREQEALDRSGAVDGGPHGISLENVSFRYPGAQADTLERIELTIDRGEALGIIGRSGQGKSTLADMIMGLFPPDSGRVLVSGIELERATGSQWRNHVGYLCQAPYFLEGSLLENIAFGDAPGEPDRDRAKRCARLAQVDFFDCAPGKDVLEHRVEASSLSGGQRLRIAIARALYKSRGLLILDEPTSALDHASSRLLRNTLSQLKGDSTLVIISHDLDLLTLCDRVAWLDQGRVRDHGKPDDVIAGFRASVADLAPGEAMLFGAAGDEGPGPSGSPDKATS